MQLALNTVPYEIINWAFVVKCFGPADDRVNEACQVGCTFIYTGYLQTD